MGNLAACLQAAAAPAAVVISDATHLLLRDDCELMGLGGVHGKGFAAPFQAWRPCSRQRRTRLRRAAERVGLSSSAERFYL